MSTSLLTASTTSIHARKHSEPAPAASTPSIPELIGRVLVVDDNARARQSMVDVLAAAGHEVVASASAVEALKVVEKTAFDVIITDLQMPGMDGLTFIRTLAERKV